MHCPFCSHKASKVVDKRDSDDAIRRRRECLKCQKRFTTYEKIEQLNIVVVKREGTRTQYDRNKMKSGIVRACQKRISEDEIEAIVDKIEREIKRLKSNEVTSQQIGKKVLKYLKKADQISYLRFASVYQDFQNVEDFQEELKKLAK